MKKSFLITFLVIMTSFFNAQIQDLASLANGNIMGSNILYDSQDQVYGYIYFFDQGNIDKENVQMEYVLLDKNLNKVSNNTFTRRKYHELFTQSFTNCSFINDNELLLKFSILPLKGNVINSFSIISIKNKTVSPDYCYKNGNIIEVPQNTAEYKKYIKDLYSTGSFLVDKKHNSILIKEESYNKFGSDKFIRSYNTKNELLWSYEYNPIGEKNNFNTAIIRNITPDNVYFLEYKHNSKYPEECKIIALDLESGKKKYEYIFENNQSEYSHTLLLKEVNNQLILTGNYSKYQPKYEEEKVLDLEKNLGFYKIVLDKRGQELSKKYIPWGYFKNQLEIDKYGSVEKNFQILPIEFFIFKDGSISILTEKYKPAKQVISLPIGDITLADQKSTDFILFSMDENFNTKYVKTIQKELTKGYNYDYLYPQYIKEGTGVIFFFIDNIKSEKKRILGINTIINGEIKEERIPISSKEDKYTILPMRAKEGYIILKEYNEKEKYNQIRLEKINY